MDTLPAELMCAILYQLDRGWWPLAAQTCIWWRTCVHTAAAMILIPTSAITTVGTQTLSAAVCGGHVNVIAWMEQASGRSYERARDMARWMASAPPCRSWRDIIAAAARDDRDDVLDWAAEHFCATTIGSLNSPVADCPVDTVMLAAIARGRWQVIQQLCTSGPLARRNRAKGTLWRCLCFSGGTGYPRIAACLISSGNRDLVEIFCTAGCPINRLALLLAAVCTSDAFSRLRKRYMSRRLVVEPFVDEVTWLADQRLTSTQSGDAPTNLDPGDTHYAFWAERPSLRSPCPDDFLPGGALEHYLSIDAEATFECALAALLWPLCTDPDYSEDHLHAWIKSALVNFKLWNAPRVAARQWTSVRLGNFGGGGGGGFDGDEPNHPLGPW
ncbi:hypothetical protein pmac_cds_466 [Pandoravirus macleodensis]|uniref:Ankyrin repeat domain containing protein n=1 Tax=Pandoravirus macleodensis TaxID=2107707 RepID=A0A2U7UFD2_9VIRU|nr:hypothetical protein pmac_cds_466 [Pandoravirus macleodensis]AVK77154.1 hypothetical protein pmac_cds_466 [Pandoravirus macleodensis]